MPREIPTLPRVSVPGSIIAGGPDNRPILLPPGGSGMLLRVASSGLLEWFTPDYPTDGEFTDALATKSDVGHIHDDRYYTESEVTASLSGKSDIGHIHDDRYFTEDEVTASLGGKAPLVHNHDDRYYTESESNALLAGKSDTTHNHDTRYYQQGTVDSLLATKAPTVHTHDDRYYTESESNSLLSGKSDTSHNHDTRYYQQSTIDTAFTSRDNNIATKETMVPTTFLNDPCDTWASTYSTNNVSTWANTRAGVNVALPAGGTWEGLIHVFFAATKSPDGVVEVGVDVSGTTFFGAGMVQTSSYSYCDFIVRVPGMSGGSSPSFKVVFRSGSSGGSSTIRSISMNGTFKRTS